MRSFISFFAILLITVAAAAQSSATALAAAPAAAAKTFTTVPITFDHNRIIIDVRLPLPDGTMKRVRGWVDTGNVEMSITGDLAKKVHLDLLTGIVHPSQFGNTAEGKVPPKLIVGGMEIATTGIRKTRFVDAESVAPGSTAEITLPATLLRNYDVIIDYPNRELTIGQPGTLQFKGTATKANVHAKGGLVQLPADVAGEKINLELDLGAPVGLLTPEFSQKLLKAHPQWPHMQGGVGPANIWGFPEETDWQVLRVPSLQYGGETLINTIFATFPPEVADWFTKRAGIETAGLIGSSAFLDYRVGLDYAHSTVYLEKTSKMDAPDIDVVGLTLRPELDETYTIVGVPEYNGKPAVPNVRAGDVLVSVDKTPAKGGTMGQVWSLLAGSPGDTRVLVVRRDGKDITVNATVQRFLSMQPAR